MLEDSRIVSHRLGVPSCSANDGGDCHIHTFAADFPMYSKCVLTSIMLLCVGEASVPPVISVPTNAHAKTPMDESVLNGAVSGCSTDDLSCWCTMVLAYFRTLFMLPFLLSHHIAADCSCSFLEIVDSCYQCTVRSHRLHCMSGCCGPLQVQSLMNMPLLFLQPLLFSLYLVDFGLLLQFSQGMQHVPL